MHGHMLLVILMEKKPLKRYTKKNYKKQIKKRLRVEKVIKRKGDKLYVKWKGHNSSFNNWIGKKEIIWISENFQEPKSLRGRVKVELDLSNYATKVDFKKCHRCWYIKIC